MMLKRILWSGCLLLIGCPTVFGAIVENYTFSGIGAGIPDGNPTGLSNVQTISSSITDISAIAVSLDISGEFNGDLYAYLQHDTEIFILLNRPGRTGANTFGYDGTAGFGFDVTFDDTAVNGDIHDYLSVTTPTFGTPLTGTWQPDGRAVDPDVVVDTDPRTATLSAVTNLDANGEWTLFVADLSSGSENTLNSWGLEITGVPEPGTLAYMVIGGTLTLLGLRRRPLGRPPR